MNSIAVSQGFECIIVLSEEATSQRIAKEIRLAAQKLSSGDIFFMTYSGHGGQVWDISDDEPSHEPASLLMPAGAKDETICLYDRQFLDDEINNYLGHFKPGVRVLVISDCCHSGSNVKFAQNDDKLPAIRLIAFEAAQETVKRNSTQYNKQWNNSDFRGSKSKLKIPVLLLSGC